jgi:aminoglycoside phosphotransferase (APT) family kinase protein
VLPELCRALVARPDVRAQLAAAELRALDEWIGELSDRLAALSSCGMPETIVHGDFHPGNWRLGPDGLRLIDWGDCGVGHPFLDLAGSFLSMVPESLRSRVRATWLEAWHEALPDADVERAADLIGPVGASRSALVYQGFLDGIEPSERPYHEPDVAASLREVIAFG